MTNLIELHITDRRPFADGHEFGQPAPMSAWRAARCSRSIRWRPRSRMSSISARPRAIPRAGAVRGGLHDPAAARLAATGACSSTTATAATSGLCNSSTTPPHSNDPLTLDHAGNGFLMRRGYASPGWRGKATSCPATAAWCWMFRSPPTTARRSPGACAPRSSSMLRAPQHASQRPGGGAFISGQPHATSAMRC